MTPTLRQLALCLIGTAGAILGFAAVEQVQAARKRVTPAASAGAATPTPEIFLSASNVVPKCVTTDRLDAVLAERNPRLDPKFKGIAKLYKLHGEKVGVRWDYAFYQMILETNSLQFTGDVKVRQNNFAGLGATGGGVPGESFADVSSGVLAQLQHLVAYGGQKVENPVAKRTRENQDDIIAKSKRLGRPVKFSDLTNRWAADSKYARSIETLAARFRDASCSGADTVAAASPPPPVVETPKAAPAATTAEPRRKGRDLAKKAIDDGKVEAASSSSLGASAAAAANCSVMAASFGGNVTLLIRGEAASAITFTALDVQGGAEDAMADSYIKVHAPGGRVAGRFKTRDDAIAHAYQLCDSGKP